MFLIPFLDVVKGISPSRREDTGILENTGVLNEDEFGKYIKLNFFMIYKRLPLTEL